jgi:acetyl esterase/lipase
MWLIVSILLFLPSLLIAVKAPTNFLWKLSVLFTEWGYYFALLNFGLAFWNGFENSIVFFLLFSSACLYAFPLLCGYWISIGLSNKLTISFDFFTQPFRFSLISLFKPSQTYGIVPRKQIYFQSEECTLELDFYRNHENAKQPCVIVVHGGGWDSGDRKQLSELNFYLASKSIAVASITYRLAPRHHFPAPLEDLRMARKYLTEHSDTLGINPIQFFYLGRSAGGQIVLTESYTNPDPSVKGVIAFYAPADMAWGYNFPCWKFVMDSRRVQRDYMGGSPEETGDAYVKASANRIVTSDAPATLMLCGRNDVLTSFHHNTRLIEALKPHKVPYFLLDLPWGVHGFDFHFNGVSSQLSRYCVEQFVKGSCQ